MKAGLAAFGSLITGTGRDSLRLWRIAIWVPLLVVIPEFIQHGAEIKLGMFASKEAFKALQNDPLRWAFGYFKVAGQFAAMAMAARFWARREGRPVAWRDFGIALAINLVATAILLAIGKVLPASIAPAANLAISIATLPLLTMLIGPLLGDRTMGLGAAYARGWLQLLRMAVLMLIVWLPLSLLHRFDHTAAFGQAPMAVWLLMAWDALVVGVMVCWAGTALHHGYFGSSPKP